MLEDGRTADEAKRRSYVATIRCEAQRLTSLIDRVLALARLERGSAVEGLERVRAGEIVREAESAFRPVVESEGRAIAGSVADEETELRADPAGLVQVLLDLLDNARKYGGAAAPIELHACREGAEYVLEVADRGRGLSPEEAGRIFEMFARGEDPQTREKPGLGIGLALARRVVEANGGRLEFRPREGGGSVFSVRLPIPERVAS
jgi:two-component system phosphate regulon sensor histidine kinase PhoR